MTRRNRWAGPAAVVIAFCAPAVFAADEKPVARVGAETVTAPALARRIARLPDFQRDALAASPDALKRRVLETMVVPDLLYAQEAARLKLAERPSLQSRLRELLRLAMDHELRQESRARAPVTADDIRSYFEANKARFDTPRRLHLWRILSDDEALAKRIIADAKTADGVQRWSQYARDNSLDKATHLRNGDLGFVHADGNTDTPTLRVDPTLFAAADALSDGEVSQEPIKEGLHWAVIWRRGSMKAVERTVEQEQGSIRQVLERERLERAREQLLERLRASYVSRVNEAALETLRFDADGRPTHEITDRPGHAAPAGSSVPEASERGTR